MKHTDRSFATGTHFVNGWAEHATLHGEKYTIGVIVLPQGIVSFYAQCDHSSLRYAANGRCYERVYKQTLTQRTAIIESKKFVAEVTNA